MATFHRVCVHHPRARRPNDNGHPLYVWPRQGAGRLDDPLGTYLVLYLADVPEAAVAEALARYPAWSPFVLAAPPAAPAGSMLALATYDGEPTVCDLDDAHRLVDLGLRPSQVVTRDRAVTQGWARELHEAHGDRAREAVRDGRRWDGASWWSFHNPDWTSIGLWDTSALRVVEIVPLTLDHPALLAAAEWLSRPVGTASRARRVAAKPLGSAAPRS